MCGIVGYIGSRVKVKSIVERLKKVEYRGYDSSGIATANGKNITVIKAVGEISNLTNKLDEESETCCAISHTRWATHGASNEINAHPHLSSDGSIAIVHNGIIENFEELRKTLPEGAGAGETDTSVVCELLAARNAQCIKKFIKTMLLLKGSYAICAVKNSSDKTMFLAKNKSPLYVAEKDGCFIVASDPVCFCNFTNHYYSFDDYEFAEIKNGKIEFFDAKMTQINKNFAVFDDDYMDSDMGNWPHFMIKEINESPECLSRLANVYRSGEIAKIINQQIQKFASVELIGCGTAYHACLVGEKYFEKIAKIPSKAHIASEFLYKNPLINKNSLYVFISQSGETADTIGSLKLVKAAGCQTLAITNVLYSTLAKLSDFVLPVCAGKEVAVAATKSYVCQLAVLYILSNVFVGQKEKAIKEIVKISKKLLFFNQTDIKNAASFIGKNNNAIFIGKDYDSITAMEACLKLKEIAYINSSAYPSGELKHGYIALVTDNTPIIAISMQNEISDKTINSANEAKARGAKIISVSKKSNDMKGVNYIINVNCENEHLAPIAAILPLQYLAYLVSIKRGLNPDKPRNLAKSVTVE